MFRYIFLFMMTAAVAWLIKRIFASATRRQMGSANQRQPMTSAASPKLLYRDPLCGSYVAEEISYPWEQGSETLHFCSRECLEHYRAGDRIAAGA